MGDISEGHPSSKLENWIKASHQIGSEDKPFATWEFQKIGHAHLGLQEFEKQWMNRSEAEAEEIRPIDWQANFYISVAGMWAKELFSVAYKMDRGSSFEKRKMTEFKGYINPLRCVLEKGYVDGHSGQWAQAELAIYQDPWWCFGWRVPNKDLQIVHYPREQIAQVFFDSLDLNFD